MWQWIKNEVDYLGGLIVWARLQYILLIVYTALQQVDLSLFISDQHLLQGYIFINAITSECLRRHNAEYDDSGSIK